MGNCLKTQLKEQVQNNELIKIGELRMKNTGSAPMSVQLGYNGIEKTLTVINGYFTDSTGQQNLGTSHIIEAGNQYKKDEVYITPNAVLCIPDKYQLTYFLLEDSVDAKYWDFNEGAFSYCTAIKYINLSGLQKSLDLSALKNMTSIVSFTLKSGLVKGDISNLSQLSNISGTVVIAYDRFIQGNIATLAKWKQVNLLTVSGTLVSGSINALGDAMYNNGNGRISGTLTLTCANYNSFAPTVTYTDPQTHETKVVDSCQLTFSDSGVNYAPTFRT